MVVLVGGAVSYERGTPVITLWDAHRLLSPLVKAVRLPLKLLFSVDALPSAGSVTMPFLAWLGFRVQGFRVGIWGLGFGVYGVWFMVWGVGIGV